jgi:putative nucleotidyltransferase with HDIG domain
MQYQNDHWAGKAALNDLTQLLVRIVDLRDPNAERHSEGVAELSAELARRINMDVDEREVLQHAAILHDVGKVAISDSVINKPSRLTRAEYLMVQQHTILGYQLLQPMKINAVITAAILSHHENYDGSGYPEGLKGETIPLAARLIRIADFYDALTSHRSYRNKVAYGSADALDILQENRHCFDPFLFDTFVEMIVEKS